MIRTRAAFVAFVALAVPLAGGTARGDEREPTDFELEKPDTAVKTLKDIAKRIADLGPKLDAQRALDVKNGAGDDPSPELLKLQSEMTGLDALRTRAVAGLERLADRAPLEYLAALAAETDASVVTEIAAIAGKCRAPRDKAVAALIAASKRLKALPVPVTEALGKLGGDEAVKFLLDRGRSDGDAGALAQAGREGSALAIGSLLELGRTSNDKLSALALQAFRTLPPPAAANLDKALAKLLEALDAKTATPVPLRAAVVQYLGSFPPSSTTLNALARVATNNAEKDDVRITACRGLQLVGRGEGDLASAGIDKLLDVLGDTFTAVAVRRAAAVYLGEVKTRRALSKLIELLGEPDLAPSCGTSLQQITGLAYGTSQDTWKRWFANEPEGKRR